MDLLGALGRLLGNAGTNIAHPSRIVNNLEGQFIAHSPNQLGHTVPASLPQHPSLTYSDPNDPTLAFRNKFVADTFAHQAANRLPMAPLPQYQPLQVRPPMQSNSYNLQGNGLPGSDYSPAVQGNYQPVQQTGQIPQQNQWSNRLFGNNGITGVGQ